MCSFAQISNLKIKSFSIIQLLVLKIDAVSVFIIPSD